NFPLRRKTNSHLPSRRDSRTQTGGALTRVAGPPRSAALGSCAQISRRSSPLGRKPNATHPPGRGSLRYRWRNFRYASAHLRRVQRGGGDLTCWKQIPYRTLRSCPRTLIGGGAKGGLSPASKFRLPE